jgi:glucokinase
VSADPRPVLALDVGGTKLAAGLVSGDGEVLTDLRIPTPSFEAGEGELLWATVRALLEDARRDADIAGVGIGCGGPMTWPEGAVSPLNIPAWEAYALRRRVAETYPGVPVRLHNDAVCFAVAEHWRGIGRGEADVVGIVVSTGVGGGLVIGGHVVDGRTGNAGHIGHLVVEPDGPACTCGGRGCLEAVASGPSIVRWAREHGWEPSVADDAGGLALTKSAVEGDEVAVAALARAGHAVGVAIASVAHLLDVRTFVLGGGLMEAGPFVLDPLRAAVSEHARLPYVSGLTVERSALGPVAGLVGAAALVAGPGYWSAG